MQVVRSINKRLSRWRQKSDLQNAYMFDVYICAKEDLATFRGPVATSLQAQLARVDSLADCPYGNPHLHDWGGARKDIHSFAPRIAKAISSATQVKR